MTNEEKVAKLTRTRLNKKVQFYDELDYAMNGNSLRHLVEKSLDKSVVSESISRIKSNFRVNDIDNRGDLTVIARAVRCVVPKSISIDSDNNLILGFRTNNIMLHDNVISYEMRNSSNWVNLEFLSTEDSIAVWKKYIGTNIKRYKLDKSSLLEVLSKLRTEITELAEKKPMYNTKQTRSMIKRKFELELPELKVICNEENNTPDLIDGNFLAIDVILSNSLAPEFIQVKIEPTELVKT